MIHVILHLGLFLVGLGLIALFQPRTSRDRGALAWAFIVGYLLRLGAILLLHLFSSDGTFLLDDRGYDEQGRYLAHLIPSVSGTEDLSRQLGTQHIAYPLLVGAVYFLGGHSILSAKLLNAFFGALLSPVVYWLASEFENSDDNGLPRRAAWLAALFPFDIAWSAFLLRDTILELLFTFLVAATVATYQRRSYKFALIVLPTLYVINLFRFYAVFVWVAAMILASVAWLARVLGSRNKRSSWPYFLTIVMVGASLFYALVPWFIQQFQFARVLAVQLAGLGDGGDATPLIFAFNLQFVSAFARAVFVYLLGPFPWVFWGNDDPINYIFYPGMYVIFFLFPFFAVGLWKTIRTLEPVGVFLVATFILHGLIEIYVFQGASRQRMMTDGVFILCAAVAWPMRQKFAPKTRFVYATLVVIAVGHTIVRAFG